MAESERNGSLVNNLRVQIRAGAKAQSSPRYRGETHGHRGDDDIHVSTPVSDFKGVFDRAKDELEAIAEIIHPKKDYHCFVSPPNKEDAGFRASIGKKISPTKTHNHQD